MRFLDLGMIDYESALNKQLETLEKVQAGELDTIILCTHPPVVTLGRAFRNKEQEVGSWQGEVVQTSRGGKATYHGPNQLVIYPIVNLARGDFKNFKQKDVHGFLRALESVIVNTLKSFGLDAKTIETPKGSDVQYTGVWVGDKKVVSIGIGVKKWITYHGAAINILPEETAFSQITPCGFKSNVMSSMEQLLDEEVSIGELKKALMAEFENEFVRSQAPFQSSEATLW